MNDPMQAAREHALTEYPRESCGVIAVVKGRKRYFPCRNLAETRCEHFILSAEDYATAEDAGEPVAIVHSHPNTRANPSEADRVGCEGSGLPWLIISVMPGHDGHELAGEIEFKPIGYESPYVGREFVHGILDCFSLCRDWYKRERGIDLPDYPRRDQWWNDGKSDLYSEHFAEAGFVPVPLKAIQPGDAILMQIQSKNRVPNHAAIYIGDGLILHHVYGRLSSRDVFGGMWQETTRMILRYAGDSTKQGESPCD